MSEPDTKDGMQRRRITLADGRYLIFYTFDEQPASSNEGQTTSESAKLPEPEAKPEAEEERRV